MYKYSTEIRRNKYVTAAVWLTYHFRCKLGGGVLKGALHCNFAGRLPGKYSWGYEYTELEPKLCRVDGSDYCEQHVTQLFVQEQRGIHRHIPDFSLIVSHTCLICMYISDPNGHHWTSMETYLPMEKRSRSMRGRSHRVQWAGPVYSANTQALGHGAWSAHSKQVQQNSTK